MLIDCARGCVCVCVCVQCCLQLQWWEFLFSHTYLRLFSSSPTASEVLRDATNYKQYTSTAGQWGGHTHTHDFLTACSITHTVWVSGAVSKLTVCWQCTVVRTKASIKQAYTHTHRCVSSVWSFSMRTTKQTAKEKILFFWVCLKLTRKHSGRTM